MNHERVRVSIVIPAYNAGLYLGQCLDSVRRQTVNDWEAIVVDDGSLDDTAEIVGSYAQRDGRIRLHSQKNQGVSVARNHGFAVTSTETSFITFLDADDTLEPNALEVLLAALEEREDCVAAHGLARYIDEHGERLFAGRAEAEGRNRRTFRGLRRLRLDEREPTSFAVFAHWNHVHTPGQVLIRREALDRAGLCDPKLHSAADYDLWLRLTLLGDFAFVDHVVLNYRQHGAAMSRDGRRMRAEEWQIWQKLLSDNELSQGRRRILTLAKIYALAEFRSGWALEAAAAHDYASAGAHLVRWGRETLRYTWLWVHSELLEGVTSDGPRRMAHP